MKAYSGMMKTINWFYAAVLSLLLFSACGKEGDPLKDAYGYLKLNFTQDNEEIVVKGERTTEPVFSVNILNSSGVIVRSCADHRELESEPLKLKAGTYSVNASSGENVNCAFEKPFYQGSKTIAVKAGNVENGEVICTLANVKVSIKIDDSMNEHFKEYLVTVKNSGSNTGLIYSSAANTLNSAGYFVPEGSLAWSLYLVNNNDIVFDGDVKGMITDIKPREHYILKFKASESNGEGGASNVTIVVDDSVNDKEQNFEINLNKKPKPVYNGEGFNLSEMQRIPEETQLPWKVSVEAGAGLARMVVSHTSLAFANAGIPYSFDLLNLTPAEKAAVQAAGLVWENGEPGTLNLTMNFTGILSKLPLGNYTINFSALDKQAQEVEAAFGFEIIPGVETTSLSVEPWAKRAFFYGVWNTLEKPAGLGMEYRKAADAEWIRIMEGFTIEGNKYSVEVKGLEPNTAYVMRTFTGKESSNEIAFTTEKAEQIPNMSFDNWYKDGKHWYANENSSSFWWDSGNKGANTLSEVNPTAPTSEVAVAGEGKQAARMESKTVFGILAAGNIYLGQFGKTIGTSGAEIYFGRPYTGRPSSLKGYYNYIPKSIDKTKSPYDNLKGQSDMCQIYIILADWGSWYTVNTSEKRFIDVANDPGIIAYGEMTRNENTNGYQSFEIPLEYRNKRTPTHCIIVASASKYGDFFTGGVGSVLYIDEFEFTF